MSARPAHDVFRWPPAPVAGEVAAVPSSWRPGRTSPAKNRSWRDHLLDIERTWLGLERPGLADMIRETGWRRDAAASYCGRCGQTAGGEETLDPSVATAVEAGCGRCRGRGLAWDRVVRLGEHEGMLRDAVLEIKFARARGLGHELGRELGKSIADQVGRASATWREFVVVPMPASRWRRFVRGIDHAAVLARGVACELNARVEPWLARSHRAPQAALSEAARRRNVTGAMRLSSRGRRRLRVEGETSRLVLVVDDVMTTGSTMREACRRLAAARADGGAVWACVASIACQGR